MMSEVMMSNNTLTQLDLTSVEEHNKNGEIMSAKKELNLTGNSVGSEGKRMILDALKNNSTLTKLDLNGCE